MRLGNQYLVSHDAALPHDRSPAAWARCHRSPLEAGARAVSDTPRCSRGLLPARNYVVSCRMHPLALLSLYGFIPRLALASGRLCLSGRTPATARVAAEETSPAIHPCPATMQDTGVSRRGPRDYLPRKHPATHETHPPSGPLAGPPPHRLHDPICAACFSAMLCPSTPHRAGRGTNKATAWLRRVWGAASSPSIVAFRLPHCCFYPTLV